MRIILKTTKVERGENVIAVGYYCVYHSHGRFKRGKDARTALSRICLQDQICE
jgi:hypothetical protein